MGRPESIEKHLAGAQERAGDRIRQAVLTVGSCRLTEENDRQEVRDSLFSVYLYMGNWGKWAARPRRM